MRFACRAKLAEKETTTQNGARSSGVALSGRQAVAIRNAPPTVVNATALK
jgi:hypothetical protein